MLQADCDKENKMLDSYRKRIVLEVARGVVLIFLFLSGQTYAQETEIQITCPDSAVTESEQSSPVLRPDVQQQLARIRTCLGTGDTACAERGLEELEEADLTDDERAALLISRGGYHSARDQLRQARRAYEEVLGSSDVHPQLTHFAAVQVVAVNMRNERNRQALEVAVEHFTCADWTPDTLLMAADAYYQRRDYVASLNSVERSISVLLAQASDEAIADLAANRNAPFVLPQRAAELVVENSDKLGLELTDEAIRIAHAVALVRRTVPRARLFGPSLTTPLSARARGIESLVQGTSGFVLVGAAVTQDGRTRDVVALDSSHTLFEQAAIDAVRQSVFVPRISNGDLVEDRYSVTVRFYTGEARVISN